MGFLQLQSNLIVLDLASLHSFGPSDDVAVSSLVCFVARQLPYFLESVGSAVIDYPLLIRSLVCTVPVWSVGYRQFLIQRRTMAMIGSMIMRDYYKSYLNSCVNGIAACVNSGKFAAACFDLLSEIVFVDPCSKH